MDTTNLENIESRLMRSINQTFDYLHTLLDDKKTELLRKLTRIKEQNIINNDILHAIKQLEGVKEKINCEVSSNLISNEKDDYLKSFRESIEKLNERRINTLNLEFIEFRCKTENIQKEIEKLSLVELIPYYIDKNTPCVQSCSKGNGPGEMEAPRGVSIDNIRDEVYVADSGNNRIQMLTLDGTYSREIGKLQLENPSGVCYHNEKIYVTDMTLDSLFKFSRDGRFEGKVGLEGTGDGMFNCPIGLTAYNGKIYVCDTNNNRIQVFDQELKYIKKFGMNRLYLPTDIKVRDNKIIVITRDDNSLHRFTLDGEFIEKCKFRTDVTSLGFFFEVDISGNFLISKPMESCIKIYSEDYTLKHVVRSDRMQLPLGVALTRLGHIVSVCEQDDMCYQVY